MELAFWRETCAVVWLVVMVMCLPGSRSQFCVWRSSISPTLPDIQEAFTDPSCRQGELWWHYPRGSLRAHIRHEISGRDFRLCILRGDEFSLSAILDETGNRKRDVPVPNAGEETCLDSENGGVILLFVAPNQSVHLTQILYTLNPA